ncbi:MAG TPA: methylmalonyl-CoA epimerase [Polyangia bacterium]|nr:methylmalonyl-CoA epimerase [Polyangia bacterium]
MIKVKRIDHVAIAVADRDAAAKHLGDLFGLAAGSREHVAGQKTDVTFLNAGGDDAASLELCAPASVDGNESLRRFLDKRGPGLHHVCFEVDDLPAALASLKSAGVRLIDETPRLGARGHWVAFLHPAATGGVLFELCAAGHGGDPT